MEMDKVEKFSHLWNTPLGLIQMVMTEAATIMIPMLLMIILTLALIILTPVLMVLTLVLMVLSTINTDTITFQ